MIAPLTAVDAPAAMADESDSEVDLSLLVRQLRRGAVDAFETLYRRLAPRIHGLALRLSGSRAEAEDLTQEAFVRAWENRARFESADHLRAWLHRVTINGWISRWRRPRALSLDDEDLPESAEPRAPAASDGTRIDLEAAIASLPERLRGVVVLHDLYGWSHDEIAERFALTAPSSRVLLHRARVRLREILR